ncbi:hypothetical protein [Longispora urticae]
MRTIVEPCPWGKVKSRVPAASERERITTAPGLVRTSLIAACLALVAGVYEIGPTEPQVRFRNTPIADAAVVLMLVSLALAAWAVATAASVAGNARPLLAAIALLTCGASFSVLDGATGLARAVGQVSSALPSFRVSWQPVPGWTQVLMIGASLVPAVVLLLPDRLLTHRVTGFLISLPLWVLTVVWCLSSHATNEIPFQLADGLDRDVAPTLSAPRSASALRFFSGIAEMGLVGWLVMLILLSGAEFARAQVTLAGRVARLRLLRRRGVLIGAALLLLAVLSLGYLGVVGASELWRVGSIWQWLYCALAAAAGAAVLRWESRHPVGAGRLRATVNAAIIGLGLPSVLLLAGSLLQLILGPIFDGTWARTALDWALELRRFSGLVAIVLVGLATALSLRVDRRHTTGSIFGIAFVVWALPSAVQIAVLGHGFTGRDLLSSPQRLVVLVCVAVLIIAVRVRPVRTPLLSRTLIGAALSAFGLDALLSGSPATAAAVLLVLLPVLWRFVVDTREEREKPAWRSVLAMATWATLIGLAAFTIGAGSGVALWDNSTRVEWNLLIVPLTFALLCQIEPAPRTVGPGWKGGAATGPARAGGPVRYAAGVVAAGVIVTAAIAGVTRVPHTEGRPVGHRATITVPAGWLPGQCELTDGEVGSITSADRRNAVVFANVPERSFHAASAGGRCPAANFLRQNLTEHRCRAAPAAPLTGLPGLSWYACVVDGVRVRYGVDDTGGTVKAILVVALVGAARPGIEAAESALTTLTFG